MQVPTVGRIVHFFRDGSPAQPIAAIITKVHSTDCVNLRIFEDEPCNMVAHFPQVRVFGKCLPGDVGYWQWPEIVRVTS